MEIKFDSFPVTKIESKEKESVTISWTTPFFPKTGDYTIYHINKANRSIIQVTSKKVTPDIKKYEYLSQPLNSTNITFMIRNITLDDAGYYAGGPREEDAWSGGGVVLIVLGESTLGLLYFNFVFNFNFPITCIVVFFCKSVMWAQTNIFSLMSYYIILYCGIFPISSIFNIHVYKF